jgi:hypothetical protein
MVPVQQFAVWTTGTNQADKQPSLWGQLRRVVGGEYVIAITDRSVVRGTYVGVEGGLDIIWQFDQISAEVGCMAAGSVCNVGRLVFFLSERGFMMCDGHERNPDRRREVQPLVLRHLLTRGHRPDLGRDRSAQQPGPVGDAGSAGKDRRLQLGAEAGDDL